VRPSKGAGHRIGKSCAVATAGAENSSSCHPDAPVIERARTLLYQTELAVRVKNLSLARSSLSATKKLKLTMSEQKSIAAELLEVSRLIREFEESASS
jgi:hypothetical protein